MTFGEKMKKMMGQGLTASRELMSKAGAKAQDLGGKGVLKLEILQLENQAQKAINRLGVEVYNAFTEQNKEVIDAKTPAVRELLAEIGELKDSIEKKERDLKN